MRVRLFSDIGHVMPKIDWGGICTSSRQKLKRACCWENITTHERVKSVTAGPVTDTYF